MSSSASVPISQSPAVAPTPVNTPLNAAPIAGGLSRPTVPTIEETKDDDESGSDGAAAVPQSGDAAQAAILGLVQGKLAGLVGKSSGYVENLPVGVRRKVEGLKGVQVQHTKLQREYKQEILELERKYLKLYTPLFDRRREIVTGKSHPTEEEVVAGEAESIKDDEEYVALPLKPTGANDEEEGAQGGIPEFWLTAFRNHEGISELITDRDEVALRHLLDVELHYLDPPQPGFKLVFRFDENEFFTNETLEKTYHYQDEVDYSGDFIYDRAVGCEINWKDEKDLTKTFEIKKQRNKTTNRTRLVKKASPTDSFFNFFAPPTPPSEEAIDAGDVDEGELEELEQRLELDYQIGEDLKEKIIPRAIDYFTGKILEYEGIDEDEDDYESEDEDSDVFDDDDSESDNDVPVKKRGGAKGKNAGSAPPTAEECKQQ